MKHKIRVVVEIESLYTRKHVKSIIQEAIRKDFYHWIMKRGGWYCAYPQIKFIKKRKF